MPRPSNADKYLKHRAKLHRRKRNHGVERAAPAPARAPSRAPDQRYGHAQERRAVHVFGDSDANLPDWWVSIRQSGKDDDANGIDAWVDTDRGPVALQVKSSLPRAQQFLAEHPQWTGAVVVLSLAMTDEQVRRAVIRAVGVVRERMAEQRRAA